MSAEEQQQQQQPDPKSPFSGILGSFTIQPTVTLAAEEDQSVQAGGLKAHGYKKPFEWRDHQVNYKELVKDKTGDPNIVVGGGDQIRDDAPHCWAADAQFPWQYSQDQSELHHPELAEDKPLYKSPNEIGTQQHGT